MFFLTLQCRFFFFYSEIHVCLYTFFYINYIPVETHDKKTLDIIKLPNEYNH